MKTGKELVDECDALVRRLVHEIADINRKYNFAKDGRSEEDEKRSKELWDELRRIEEKFDAEHPVSPCPECGSPRFASTGGHCFNWYDNCSLATPLGG